MEMPQNQNDNITSLTGNNSQILSQLEIIVNLICKNHVLSTYGLFTEVADVRNFCIFAG